MVMNCITPSVSSESNDNLTHPFLSVEVEKAIKSMHPHKAPSLDEIHVVFFPRMLACCRGGEY